MVEKGYLDIFSSFDSSYPKQTFCNLTDNVLANKEQTNNNGPQSTGHWLS